MEIRSRSGALLYSDAYTTMRQTLEAACAAGADLSNANLEGVYIDGKNYSGNTVNLSNGNFEGASFKYATIYHANFTGANLRGCDFTGFNREFSDTVANASTLINAKLNGAKFADGNGFAEATLTGVDYRGSDWDAPGVFL